MKKISFLLSIILLCSFICPLVAQPSSSAEVVGKYKKKNVKIKYVTGKPAHIQELKYEGEELETIINNYESKIKRLNQDINNLKNQIPNQSQTKNQSQQQSHSSKTGDSLLRQQNNALLEEKWNLEDRLKSLQDTVQMLEDSVNLLKASLEKVNNQLAELSQIRPALTGTSQHVGAYYRIGSPWLINKSLDSDLWSRKVTFSHQGGLYWNSASFSDKLPMTYGAGLECSRIKFSAGVGHLSDTIPGCFDIDGDQYIAYLTYNNVNEEADLYYLSIPLTFSIGVPRTDRVCGYFQISLVPSLRVGKILSADGKYSRAGLYRHFKQDTTTLNLYLDDFPLLGFDSGMDLSSEKKNDEPRIGIVVSGRLSGGAYIPLCNTAKGETSQWALKVGVNFDMSFPITKQRGNVASKAKYQLDQYNILSGRGWWINPGLEVGMLYIFNY